MANSLKAALKEGQKPTQCSSNRPREGEVASPVEVASAALGFETIPPLLATSAENKTTLVVDTKVSAPNRYTKYQVGVLSAAYKMCTKPARKQHRELSETIGLTERQSKIWFQNKRQRQRNALSMSQNDTLKKEISEMLESLQNAKYRSHILEIENQGLNSDLKRKAAQLDELENLKYLLFSGLPKSEDDQQQQQQTPTDFGAAPATKRTCLAA